MDIHNTTHLGPLSSAMNESDWPSLYNQTSQYPYGARIFVATAVIIISLLGIIGNTIVLISVGLSCKLQTITNVFVANLSMADLLMSLCGFTNAVVLLIRGGLPASLHSLCLLVAFTSPSVAGVIMFSIASIATNRMLLIVKHATVYRVMYKPHRLVAMVILIWLLPFLLVIILLATGIGKLSYNHRTHVCLDDSKHAYSELYKILLSVILFPIPLTVTLVCYGIIYVFLRRHFKKEEQTRSSFRCHASTTTTSQETSFTHDGVNSSADVLHVRKKRIHKHQIQITKNLFIVSCVCFLLPLPNTTFIILGRDDLFLYGSIFLFANSAINPLLYGAKHPMFKEVMLCILHRDWSAIPEPSRILKALLKKRY